MTLHTDTGFSTGTYVVTRAAVGDWVDGRFVRGTPTTFNIDAAEYPGDEGAEEQTQGTEAHETRTLFTDTALFAATPTAASGGDTGVGREADLVTIEGAQWIVRSVNHYKVISGHYKATVERLFSGEAT